MADGEVLDGVPVSDIQGIVWDDADMRHTYANVVNVAATNEEISLLFGANKAWRADVGQVEVKLSDRLMLTPHAAKRLLIMLSRTMKKYEDRNGEIRLTTDPVTPGS